MPELPELEVICEVLRRRLPGQTITDVAVLPPGGAIVVRDLTGQGFRDLLIGKEFRDISRRGKFLILALQAGQPALFLVVNFKLSGRFQLGSQNEKRMARTFVELSLSSGVQLRYIDRKQMGQLYLTTDLRSVPGFSTLGPEPFDLPLEEFRARLKKKHGEIKGILTSSEFIAGIGNAYADEILWKAGIHPFRRRDQLTEEQEERLFAAVRSTLSEAVQILRTEMGEHIEREPREFLSVHMKTGGSCPRCGTSISKVSANQRITNFCRTCQPGGLVKGL